jgi:SynChlorMet cassette protein ScmD
MEPKLIVNPVAILVEDFDDCTVLFDPDTGDGFGLNSVAALVWRDIKVGHSIGEIVADIRESCEDVPSDVEAQVKVFIDTLKEKGLVGTACPENLSLGQRETNGICRRIKEK